jgi:hypothetical protein
MITIRGRFSTYGEVWFDEDPLRDMNVDILMLRSRPSPLENAECAPFQSLASDLTVEADALMARFGGNNRYKIKRADSKDGLTFEFITETAPHLEAFCGFYDGFAQQKELPAAYRRGLDAASAAGQLVLSSASRGGDCLVWHAYVRSRSTAALLHSASHFRDGKESIDRALVGRANRWLHWKDMIAFKALGVARYDWGGMFDDESVAAQASINNFKREFGGEPVQTYNCTVALTWQGRVYLRVRSMIERLTPR